MRLILLLQLNSGLCWTWSWLYEGRMLVTFMNNFFIVGGALVHLSALLIVVLQYEAILTQQHHLMGGDRIVCSFFDTRMNLRSCDLGR